MSSNLWDEILARVENKVSRYIFHTWFKPTRFIENDDNAVTVLVPNDGFKQWLTRHYAGVIREAADELGQPGTTISLITDDSPPVAGDRASPNPPEPAPGRRRSTSNATPSRSSSSDRPTSSLTRPPAPSPRPPRGPTTRCSSTAASASARPT